MLQRKSKTKIYAREKKLVVVSKDSIKTEFVIPTFTAKSSFPPSKIYQQKFQETILVGLDGSFVAARYQSR